MNYSVKPAFTHEIERIADFAWSSVNEETFLDVAWAYYYFSVQFRENLVVARELFPEDENLAHLEREECNTDNLSPWPGVVEAGEPVDHDEFMRRLLLLSPIADDKRAMFEAAGARYLEATRAMDPMARALSIASYEDGGLERTFRAFLQAPEFNNPALKAFRHFLSEHIRFDSNPDEGHGALARHLQPDDRILPLWQSFADMLVEFAPSLRQR